RFQRAHDAELIRNVVILQSSKASVKFGSRPRSVRFIRILKRAEPPSKNEQRDDSQRKRNYATNDDNDQRHPIEEMPHLPSEGCTRWRTQREPSSSGFLLNKTAQSLMHCRRRPIGQLRRPFQISKQGPAETLFLMRLPNRSSYPIEIVGTGRALMHTYPRTKICAR